MAREHTLYDVSSCELIIIISCYYVGPGRRSILGNICVHLKRMCFMLYLGSTYHKSQKGRIGLEYCSKILCPHWFSVCLFYHLLREVSKVSSCDCGFMGFFQSCRFLLQIFRGPIIRGISTSIVLSSWWIDSFIITRRFS